MKSFGGGEVFRVLNPKWEFLENSVEVICEYENDIEYKFQERFVFEFPTAISKFSENEFIAAIEILAIASATSYYKAFCSKRIEISFPITGATLEWVNALFDDGLREFRYRNEFDLDFLPTIVADKKSEGFSEVKSRGLTSCIVPIGGGKDSATTLNIIQKTGLKTIGFSVGTFEPIDRCAGVAGIDLVRVSRSIDPTLFELNKQGAPNGHIPVTAINSSLANIAAIAIGFDAVVMSNEASADEPTRNVDGLEINHQWSKSTEAEGLLREVLKSNEISVEYFSALRGLSEFQIFELFADFDEYHKAITSCNRAFRIDESIRSTQWCGDCDKCRFVFLGLSAFRGPEYTSEIFGANLFEDESQIQGFIDLLGIEDSKPFECVGTAKESRTLARNALLFDEASNSVVGKALEQALEITSSLNEKIPSQVTREFLPTEIDHTIDNLRVKHFQNHLQDHLRNTSIAVVGLGRDTSAIIRFLENHASAKTIDIYIPSKPELSQNEFDMELKANGLDSLSISLKSVTNLEETNADLVFVSPGVSKYKDEIVALGERATTPLAWWLSYVKQHFTEKFFIGVTGTKGKSTTSSMITHVLDNALVAGNLGHAVGGIALEDLLHADFIVLEISSYQSSYITTPPDVVAVTSLFDCHIDWHLTPENYRRDKLTLALRGPSEIVASDTVENFAPSLIRMRDEMGFPHVIDVITLVESAGKSLLERNREMVREIVRIVEPRMGEDVIEERLSTFVELVHRQEIIANRNGVLFVSDVLSTAPEASIMAIDDFSLRYPDARIYLLCGGAYQDVDLSPLVVGLNNRKSRVVAITLPETGHMIESELENFEHCDELSDGVEFAAHTAKSGDIVLLAPGAPSFHRYKNYEELAAHFKALVSKL